VIKTAPSPLRLAALIAFVLSCILTLTYLWIGFGGTVPFSARGYRIEVAFPQASELATGADVRIAGVNVGKVVALQLDPRENRTLATLEIQRQYAPVPRDIRAMLRIKTLLGETYVDLSTGNRSSGMLGDGGRLPDGEVKPNVNLDQILATFDPATRRAFQTWMQAQAGGVLGRGQDINAAFGNFPEFVDTAERLTATLERQSAGVRGVVANGGTFFNAISRRRGELSGLILAANDLFQTTAQRNQELVDLFRALPGFELQSRLALPALTAFGNRADPVVRALDPIASELTTTFSATAQLAPQLRALFERLGPTVTASQRGLPALDRILGRIPPLLGAFQPFLRNANPIVRYIGGFKPEIAGFFANVTAASQARSLDPPNAPGREIHYLRSTQTLTPETLAFLPHELGIGRDNAYRAPGAFNELATGLAMLNSAQCSAGNPAPPVSASPPSLSPLIQQYVFRTAGRDIAAPPCRQQATRAGYPTRFPQLRADPPPGMATR
jgi:phospholipid/cholesterol/gamma-HCH transport system substrate-binding protein